MYVIIVSILVVAPYSIMEVVDRTVLLLRYLSYCIRSYSQTSSLKSTYFIYEWYVLLLTLRGSFFDCSGNSVVPSSTKEVGSRGLILQNIIVGIYTAVGVTMLVA